MLKETGYMFVVVFFNLTLFLFVFGGGSVFLSEETPRLPVVQHLPSFPCGHGRVPKLAKTHSIYCISRVCHWASSRLDSHVLSFMDRVGFFCLQSRPIQLAPLYVETLELYFQLHLVV